MITEKCYNETIWSLVEKVDGISDAVSVETWPYSHFVTKSGQMHASKKGFYVRINIGLFNIKAIRVMEILGQTITKLHEWMGANKEKLYFVNHHVKSVGGDNSRIQIDLVFDNTTDLAIRLLSYQPRRG